MTIQRIVPGSLAKVLGVLDAILGLIAGVLFAATAAMGFGALPGMSGLGSGIGVAVAAIVCLPIVYGLLGWIGGWVIAAFYNWVARRFGGIVLDTQ